MKQVVITGSSKGIGFAMARAFLGLGWDVAISGRDETRLKTAAAELNAAAPGRVRGFRCDVSRFDEVVKLWDFAAQAGRVDVWINNAGVNQRRGIYAAQEASIALPVVATNIVGLMYGTHVAYRGMSAQGGGRIYNMEGLGSDGMMVAGSSIYGTSKAAVRYFTRCFAKEIAGGSVVVGTISPGMVATDFLLDSLKDADPAEAARTVRLFNILADKAQTVGDFLARRIDSDRAKEPRIFWLTKAKVFARFALAAFRKRTVVSLGD